ncbi:hypothetical protein ABH935_009458 [Catenulispora sp. GAS73]
MTLWASACGRPSLLVVSLFALVSSGQQEPQPRIQTRDTA